MIYGRYQFISVVVPNKIPSIIGVYTFLYAFAIYDKETETVLHTDINSITTFKQLNDHNYSIIEECYYLNRIDVDDELYLKEIIAYVHSSRLVDQFLIKKWKSIPPF